MVMSCCTWRCGVYCNGSATPVAVRGELVAIHLQRNVPPEAFQFQKDVKSPRLFAELEQNTARSGKLLTKEVHRLDAERSCIFEMFGERA